MSDFIPENFQAAILRENNVPENNLHGLIVHYPTMNEFQSILPNNSRSIRILVCTEEDFFDLTDAMIPVNLQTIYVISDQTEIMWPLELFNQNLEVVPVSNEAQLMRHLYTKIMLCYYQQALKYQATEDNGLANACLSVALDALDQARQFL